MYEKQIRLPEIGATGQERLKQAKVLCVGAGGLGVPVVTYLSSCGVGTLGIIDADIVELSNLHRQPLYNVDDVGKSKVELLKEYVLKRGMGAQVNCYNEMLTRRNAIEIISSYDVVIDATDNFETKYMLNDACFFSKKTLITASVAGFEGSCISFDFFNDPTAPCYRCLYPVADTGAGLSCDSLGVLGAVPGLLGVIQSIECIQHIIGITEARTKRESTLLVFDAIAMSLRKLKVTSNPSCELCMGTSQFGDLLKADVVTHALSSCEFLQKLKQGEGNTILLDVRSAEEYQNHNIGGELIPVSELAYSFDRFNKNDTILIHCEHGMRSKKACELLLSEGFKNVFYLNSDLASLNLDSSCKTSC